MNPSAVSSSIWIQEFADLAKRLATQDIVTHSLRADWGTFGSWQLIVKKREEAIRFTYDGRDSFITIESSPIRDHSAPNEWQEDVVKGIDNTNNEVFGFCEDFLRKRLSI